MWEIFVKKVRGRINTFHKKTTMALYNLQCTFTPIRLNWSSESSEKWGCE